MATPWNKGLTKDDSRVKYIDRILKFNGVAM